ITGAVSTHSIKDALNGDHESTPDEQVQKASEELSRDNDFTFDRLNEKWLEFAEKIKDDKPRMHSFLKNHLPELKEEYRIVVNFNNSAQLDMFDTEIKPELKDFLSSELDNNVFRIVPHLTENQDGTDQLYTQEAKYEHLKKKNPALEQLKKDFNLDFE
ncbi:unnamed protein product, partial [marine sediment metagenome]